MKIDPFAYYIFAWAAAVVACLAAIAVTDLLIWWGL